MKIGSALLAPVFAALLASCGSPGTIDSSLPRAEAAAPEAYAPLLKKYVTPEGVRYAGWHANEKDRAALESVTDFYAKTRAPEEKTASLAWHLNAYNAWILREMLEKYPTDGPLAGNPLFFENNRLTLSGAEMSFDHLEQKIIRPTFDEPRIHFAINCASESCPPLHPEPFAATTLDSTLEKLTDDFINDNPQGVTDKGSTVVVSRIFDWYAEDFGGKGNLIPYLNKYRDQKISDTTAIKFRDYDWSLNAAK